MYFCDKGIVLRQRPLRDNDKIVTIFTETRGRLEINFKSVRKQKAKLRPLSETFVFGDYRFYEKSGSALPVCTGGKVITVFPILRLSSEKIFFAFYFCELLINMTPINLPSKEKFELIKNALYYLQEHEPSFPLLISYAMLILEYCGVGFMKSNIGFSEDLWERMHMPDFSLLDGIKEDRKTLELLASSVFEKIREHSGREINSLKFVKI